MKYVLALCACIAVVLADVSHIQKPSNEYLPPGQSSHPVRPQKPVGPVQGSHPVAPVQGSHPSTSRPSALAGDGPFILNDQYVPPAAGKPKPKPGHVFGADGYKYKHPASAGAAEARRKYRQRRRH